MLREIREGYSGAKLQLAGGGDDADTGGGDVRGAMSQVRSKTAKAKLALFLGCIEPRKIVHVVLAKSRVKSAKIYTGR